MKSRFLAVPILLLAGTATAQPSEDRQLDVDLADESRTGIGVAAGVGVAGFTGDTLRAAAGAGASWDLRGTFGVRSPIGVELSYIGSAEPIEAVGLDSDALLVGNGAQAVVRLNAITGYSTISPFLFGGVAWRHYSIVNTDNDSALADSDDVLELPVGIGLSTHAGRNILVDIRGELRYVTRGDLVSRLTTTDPSADDADDPKMHRWGISLTVGVEI